MIAPRPSPSEIPLFRVAERKTIIDPDNAVAWLNPEFTALVEASMTGTQTQSIDRNIEAAERFLDRVSTLPPADRERIRRDTFGTSAHTSALMMVADEVTTCRNKDKQGRLGAFLVDVERRVDGLQFPAEVGDLVKGAARAILVQDTPGLERATRQLLSPFELVIPNAGSTR